MIDECHVYDSCQGTRSIRTLKTSSDLQMVEAPRGMFIPYSSPTPYVSPTKGVGFLQGNEAPRLVIWSGRLLKNSTLYPVTCWSVMHACALKKVVWSGLEPRSDSADARQWESILKTKDPLNTRLDMFESSR